jgi:hypothetical protein
MGRRRGHWARESIAVAGLAVLLAAAAAVLIDRGDGGGSPALAVAVFGTFLTSMSIIAAFSIEEGSRWPTPWEMLARAGVSAWFAVGLGSVVVALLADIADCAFLTSFSLTLALAGLLLGARGLWGLFSLSSDLGRWNLVVDLLARSIRDAGPLVRGEEAELGEIDTEDHVPAWFAGAGAAGLPHSGGVSIEFVPSVLRTYADRRDPDAISRLVDEVHAAALRALADDGWADLGAYLGSVDAVLGVQRRLFGELALRVLSGRLGDATARGALARAGETAIDVAGRARSAAWPTIEAEARAEVERLVVRHLTALCRLAGSAAVEAEARLGAARRAAAGGGVTGVADSSMVALRDSCARVQQAARWAVDPDPPGMKPPAGHPWRSGLSDPEAALVWLWSAAEAPAGPFGVGLYALCEILTGRKFFGSYWDGLDVFTEIERRLRGPDGERPVGLAGRAALERAGGLASLSLELGALRLAGRPARAEGGVPQDDRHLACDLFLAAGGYKPAGRDPVAELSRLLTDRLQGSLWTTVHAELGQLQGPATPPLRPLHRRPDACALAICLRLVPLEERPGASGEEELRAFVARLPGGLLAETAALALRLTSAEDEPSGGERSELESRLIEAVRFVRRVVPGALPPGVAAGGAGDAANGRDAAIDGPQVGRLAVLGSAGDAPDEFAEALRLIANGEEEIEVDLIQCDPRWLDRWPDLRTGLDEALLSAVLRGRARVRRIIPFGLSGDAERRMTKLHYRWSDALAAAVGCFEARPGKLPVAPSPYRVRLLVQPFAKEAVPLQDYVVLRGPGARDSGNPDAAGRFEELWDLFDPDARIGAERLGMIELGGRGASPGPVAPLLETWRL